MKAANSLTQRSEKKSFSAVITGDAMQSMIRKSLGDPSSAARFTSTLISVVSQNDLMKNCDPNTIIACALRGEGMGLTYGEGYYVVPFGSVATFVPGYKGFIQRSIATGLYADIDVVLIRDGERKGRDPRTGKAVIDLSTYDTDEERERHPIIGVKAYFLLRDGFYREEYWTVDEILRHADRYSKAFSLATFNKWKSGEKLTDDELNKVKGPYDLFLKWRAGEDIDPKISRAFSEMGAWYDEGGRQINMMKKTVLRSLLNSGYAPLSPDVRSLLQSDREDGVVPEINIPVDFSANPSTGEVIEGTATVMQDAPQDTDNAPKTPRKSKTENETPEADSTDNGANFTEIDASDSFFGN